ncbi:MAG: Cys-tRNA(Pro) deacylase [Clostridia bacterium]|nr:Cys-tRNA(Pro) deacylase [Clostridia bacterium]
MQDKTNVMRILDSKKIEYKAHYYTNSDAIAGLDVVAALNENPNQAFKTLVTRSASKNYYVFVVPVSGELDLKKAAKSVNEKSVEMIKQKELLPLTGYIHGGCSPIGMKKQFNTVIDISAKDFETIFVSGGKIGYQIEMKVEDFSKVIRVTFEDIVRESHD